MLAGRLTGHTSGWQPNLFSKSSIEWNSGHPLLIGEERLLTWTCEKEETEIEIERGSFQAQERAGRKGAPTFKLLACDCYCRGVKGANAIFLSLDQELCFLGCLT